MNQKTPNAIMTSVLEHLFDDAIGETYTRQQRSSTRIPIKERPLMGNIISFIDDYMPEDMEKALRDSWGSKFFNRVRDNLARRKKASDLAAGIEVKAKRKKATTPKGKKERKPAKRDIMAAKTREHERALPQTTLNFDKKARRAKPSNNENGPSTNSENEANVDPQPAETTSATENNTTAKADATDNNTESNKDMDHEASKDAGTEAAETKEQEVIVAEEEKEDPDDADTESESSTSEKSEQSENDKSLKE